MPQGHPVGETVRQAGGGHATGRDATGSPTASPTTQIQICTCVYIYIYRERERERYMYIYIYTYISLSIYIYISLSLYIYIYIYIYIPAPGARVCGSGALWRSSGLAVGDRVWVWDHRGNHLS